MVNRWKMSEKEFKSEESKLSDLTGFKVESMITMVVLTKNGKDAFVAHIKDKFLTINN